jgi:hypothetical protein
VAHLDVCGITQPDRIGSAGLEQDLNYARCEPGILDVKEAQSLAKHLPFMVALNAQALSRVQTPKPLF